MGNQVSGGRLPQYHEGRLQPLQCRNVRSVQFVKGEIVPKLTVEGVGTFEITPSKRLVLALEQDAGIDQLHACGGHARCTTCRVEFVDGEPQRMTIAEREVLLARGLTGVRLSCQILCDHDITVRAISRLAGSGRKDTGTQPAAQIEPPVVWYDREAKPSEL